MSNLPKRSDPIYKEIESFEDYELTQCVAYEMAIRNDKNLAKVEEIKSYYEINKEKINDFQRDGDNFYLSLEFDTIDKQINDVNFLYSDYYDKRMNLYPIVKTIEEIKKYYRGDGGNSYDDDYGGISKTKTIKRKGYKLVTYLTHYEERIEIDSLDPQQIEYVVPEYYHSRGNYVYKNFKRPMLKTNRLESKNAVTEIDLSKPLDELIAYITYVKKDLENNENTIKAPIELLGTELQKADDISKMCTVNKNGKELCFDGRKGITRTQKLADMFFIYDMVKNGYKELRIRTAISEYYETEYNKTTDISDATFRKYRDIAKDYIDNERYKELVTGVKS